MKVLLLLLFLLVAFLQTFAAPIIAAGSSLVSSTTSILNEEHRPIFWRQTISRSDAPSEVEAEINNIEARSESREDGRGMYSKIVEADNTNGRGMYQDVKNPQEKAKEQGRGMYQRETTSPTRDDGQVIHQGSSNPDATPNNRSNNNNTLINTDETTGRGMYQ